MLRYIVASRPLHERLRPDADEATRAPLVRSLRAATRLLPGFEMADLGQACCALHAAPRALACG